MIDTIIGYITEDTGLPLPGVRETAAMMAAGDTVPFIARYRKERTGGLDETALRTIGEKLLYYAELEKRKETILATIRDQKKLTPALEKDIAACREKQKLEDLYLPFKPKRTTKASLAREKGLAPLADLILAQEIRSGDKPALIAPFINPAAGIVTPEQAVAGAQEIIAEQVADTAAVRGALRAFMAAQGSLRAAVRKEWEGKKTKFEMYYAYSEAVATVPSHRILAIRRGAKEEVLAWKIDVEEDEAIAVIARHVVKNVHALFYPELAAALRLSYEKSLYPSLQIEIFAAKLEEADREAIAVFSRNAKNLLLAAPAGHKAILGLDPGFRTGCKLAVIDGQGVFKEYQQIFPHEPQNRKDEAEACVCALIKKYGIELIAIGNGTASKESDLFIRAVIKKNGLQVTAVLVSEAGASVYSASPLAISEFPALDVTVRGAISIARRLQDPLAELVKIDPKSIGVGQYQHDVNQYELKKSLDATVESCVNFVGVNLNSASAELLGYVAGIGPALARSIVAYRNQQGLFASRNDLLAVPKLGKKAFEQCAGFLRIPGGHQPLDNSAIHPERYAVVEQMARDCGVDPGRLVGNTTLINRIDPAAYVSATAGLPTLRDIVQELKKPGLDPRKDFSSVAFSDTVNELTDLQENMHLDGTVTNVTNFGAFVDIGVHQDGLVHISKLSTRFVRDPHDIVAVGDRVRVKVLSVDTELQRISLQIVER